MSTTAVNLQSARARGIAVPNPIQLLANEVIEGATFCCDASGRIGTSRQFAAQGEFGCNWRPSGHATGAGEVSIPRD